MTRMAGFGPKEAAEHQAKVSASRSIGGHARADSLSPDRRTEIAKQAAQARWAEGKPRSKYGAEPTVVDGIRFASKKEAHQDAQLLLRQGSGQIRGLQRQVPYPLTVSGVLVTTYFADWTYWEGDKLIVRDAKGHRTDVYKLKAKLMLALYGITILES